MNRSSEDAALDELRRKMVDDQLQARGIRDPRVLDAMRAVPRHHFVAPRSRAAAYEDRPLPIGDTGQTISQPFIVAFMAEALRLTGSERVLEIGTGSGYQTAVLARLAAEVYSIEIDPRLGATARMALEQLDVINARFGAGDGMRGWPDAAPFDRIVLSAASPSVPEDLLAQLKDGGSFLGPLGPTSAQHLLRITRHADGFATERLMPVVFVPIRRMGTA